MKAMILAAGKGTRVSPFTTNSPKPLLKVLGEPIIEHIIGFLRRNCIEDVFINTSFLADKLQENVGNGSRYNMNFTYSFEGFKSGEETISMPLGSAGGIRKVQNDYQCFDDTFIVLCGDALIDFDLDYAVAMHKSRKSLATVMIKEVEPHRVSNYGVVDMNTEQKIVRFQEKPKPAEAISNKVSTGVYIFEPEIFDHIPKNGVFDIGGELLPLLAEKGEEIYGCEVPMQWLDIGNIHDLWQANLAALYQQVKYFPLRGREVKPGVFTANNVIADWDSMKISGPVYIASGTKIHPNVIIKGPVIISENCVIEANTCLENVVVDPYVHIHEHCALRNLWINPAFFISLRNPKLCIEEPNWFDSVSDSRSSRDMANVTPLPIRQFKLLA